MAALSGASFETGELQIKPGTTLSCDRRTPIQRCGRPSLDNGYHGLCCHLRLDGLSCNQALSIASNRRIVRLASVAPARCRVVPAD